MELAVTNLNGLQIEYKLDFSFLWHVFIVT